MNCQEIKIKDVLESWVETIKPKDDFEKEASEIIISALEKQIPKKVKWTPAYQSYISAGDEAEPFCPECGDLIEDEQQICFECYQVIDWRVEECDEAGICSRCGGDLYQIIGSELVICDTCNYGELGDDPLGSLESKVVDNLIEFDKDEELKYVGLRLNKGELETIYSTLSSYKK